MRHLLGIFGFLAATALVIVSAAMNWRFGFGLGQTEFDGHVYGLASVAADCLKAIAPFLIIYAWKTQNGRKRSLALPWPSSAQAIPSPLASALPP